MGGVKGERREKKIGVERKLRARERKRERKGPIERDRDERE
jgi:hypothetical protein